MPYNYPTTINATKGLPEILNYTNEVTYGWIINMVLIAVWFIILIGYYKAKGEFGEGFAVAGFITLLVGLMFWAGGILSTGFFSIVVGMAIIGVIFFMVTKGN